MLRYGKIADLLVCDNLYAPLALRPVRARQERGEVQEGDVLQSLQRETAAASVRRPRISRRSNLPSLQAAQLSE